MVKTIRIDEFFIIVWHLECTFKKNGKSKNIVIDKFLTIANVMVLLNN
jgi:hypothetical protein